jgi:hypothetical protein
MPSLQDRLRIPSDKKAGGPFQSPRRPRRFTAVIEAAAILAVLYLLTLGPVVSAGRAGYLNWDEQMLLFDIYQPVLDAGDAPVSGWIIRAYIDWWSQMGSAAASRR